ncbi:MAG: DinB family protein [Caldilineaceae bacterium]
MQKEELTQIFQRNVYVVKRQTEGLNHADSVKQPPFRGNCLNWVLGHVLESRNHILAHLAGQPILDEEQAKLYCSGSQPVTPDSPSVTLGTLLALMEESQNRIEGGFNAATEEDLGRIINEERQTTTAGMITFLAWHESYHIGQLEYLRQLAGKNDAIF